MNRSSEALIGSVSGGRYHLKLMNLNQVHILDLGIPHSINRKIMTILAGHSWYKANDTMDSNDDSKRLKDLEDGKSSGWGIHTMRDKLEPLDVYAEFIFEIILKQLNTLGTIERCFWNLYFPGDSGQVHTDTHTKGCLSAIYPLHTTDGLTVINDKEYRDLEGFAKIFPSNTLHRGVGPVDSKFRMNLNLVFKIDNIIQL